MAGKKKTTKKAKKELSKSELKKIAKLLSGKKLEFKIQKNTIELSANGQFIAGFTGKIMAEDYRTELKDIENREAEVREKEDNLITIEHKLEEREELIMLVEEYVLVLLKEQELMDKIKELPPEVLSRFEIIIQMRDKPKKKKDK